jgi:hypothetical protein
MAEPFRLLPALPAADMQTYNITSRQRPATCEEVDCRHHREGWVTVADEATDLGQRQAAHIRGDRTRKATETRTEAGLTHFSFGAGQKCFGSHTLPWEGREASAAAATSGATRAATCCATSRPPTGWRTSPCTSRRWPRR